MLAICAIGFAPLLRSTAATASCGSESCPLALPEQQFEKSRLAIDVSLQFIDQDRVRIGTHRASVGELESQEDEVRTRNRTLTALARLRLSDAWALSVSLPVVNRLHRHIANEEEGGPMPQQWDFTGLGDLTILGHWTAVGAAPQARTSVTLHAGAKLPTGRRNVEEVDGEQPEPPARPGTGSTDALLGLHVMHVVETKTPGGLSAMMPLFGGILFRMNGRGTEDYRVGNQLEASIGANYRISGRVEVLTQLNARFRGKDDIGETEATRDNTGGRALFLSPGVRVRTIAGVAAYAYVQVPLYQRVNRIQLVAPYNLLVGLTYLLPR